MTVEVVHVKDYGKTSHFLDLEKKELFLYCGRPSKLSNPFFMEDESKRDEVIAKFQANLPPELIDELREYCVAKGIEKLFLGCFCAPKACHCDVIKKELSKNSAIIT